LNLCSLDSMGRVCWAQTTEIVDISHLLSQHVVFRIYDPDEHIQLAHLSPKFQCGPFHSAKLGDLKLLGT